MEVGAGGNWRRFDEKFDASIVKQTELSCLSAVGAMLLRNRKIDVSQETIRDIIGIPSFIGNLARTLNHFDISDDGLEWRGFPTTNESLEVLLRHHKNWGVVLINDYRDRIGHAVFIDGRTKNGLIKIKDTFDQTSYKMTMENFLNHWGGEVIVRWIPDTK
jgi:ABC-type bacteriocin/lantibiotic exporter with double-glycine peptidase domain